MMVLSLGMFLFIGPVSDITDDAARSLTDTTPYVHAVLGDPEDGIGVVLPSEQYGLAHSTSEAEQ